MADIGAGSNEPADPPVDTAGPPPNAVVVRFRPTEPASVFGWAEKEFRRTGNYRLSVFADAGRPGENRDAVITRLLAVAELAGVDPGRNKKYWVCTTAAELLERGFTFHKDDEEDELEEHYSVDLGATPTLRDVERFLEPFGPPGGESR